MNDAAEAIAHAMDRVAGPVASQGAVASPVLSGYH